MSVNKKHARRLGVRKITHSSTKEQDEHLKYNGDTPVTSTFNNKVFVFGANSSSTQALYTTTIPLNKATTATVSFEPQINDAFSKSLHINDLTVNSTALPSTPSTSTRDTNIYSISKILEKTTPNQIGAALDASRQNQIVKLTNFPIDHILPTTRYTELPEQARMEIDEIYQYIRDESQRYDNLVKKTTPAQQQTMKEIRHEQEMMHYKLDGLSSSLQIQLDAVKELFDALNQQADHLSHALAVFELCNRSRGQGSSRQQYDPSDHYIVHLSTHLASRLKEIMKFMNDIDLMTDSWIKNKVQYPKDIPRIMKSQNKTFLTLTNQVAILHERLTMEQEMYT